MDKDTFFNIKRAFLLSVFAFALCYPFMDYSFNWGVAIENAGHILTEKITIFILPENIAPAQTMGDQVSESFKLNWLNTIYLTGVVLFLSRIIIQLIGITINIRKSHITYLAGKKVYISPQPANPYSFFRYIIINNNKTEEKDLQEILRHEEAHVKQWHSVDVIFSQLMSVFCWFNPFVWLMTRKIRMNLEFIADRSVLKSGYESEHYQSHILRLSYHKAAILLYNGFNSSLLKKRIKMMNKKKTPGIYFLKYITIAPVILTLLFVNSSFKPEETRLIENDPISITSITEQQTAVADSVNSISTESEKVYNLSKVDQGPSFMGGGLKEMDEYFNKNLVYPEKMKEENIEGEVACEVIIDKTGKVNIKILKTTHPLLEAEVIRIFESMPEWTPAKLKGEAVSVLFGFGVVLKTSISKD